MGVRREFSALIPFCYLTVIHWASLPCQTLSHILSSIFKTMLQAGVMRLVLQARTCSKDLSKITELVGDKNSEYRCVWLQSSLLSMTHTMCLLPSYSKSRIMCPSLGIICSLIHLKFITHSWQVCLRYVSSILKGWINISYIIWKGQW